ncbi:MAG TPA: fibrinogen-binding protein [Planctomycetaceae bacterium]|nr:fibrinogen-binding protein [Planctomycetaceae bacterium]
MDPGETRIPGVRVELLDADGNRTGTTTTTVDGGYYEFLGLVPGVYGVIETQPDGYYDGLDTAGNAGGFAHNPGDSITGAVLVGGIVAENYNFGELRPARLQGTVFVDLDGDLMPDEGETRLRGVTIHLLDESGKRIASTTTDANGEYRFENLRPGAYGVEEIQPAGYLDGNEKVGSAGGTLAANDLMMKISLGPGEKGVDYNFCELLPASISGYVFQDGPTVKLMWYEPQPPVNTVSDGQFTPDDTPIAGVTLRLCDASGLPINGSNGRPMTTVTNAQGYYEFTGLAPGVYTVFQTQPTGYVDGIDTAGSLGGIPMNADEYVDSEALRELVTAHGNDAILAVVVHSGDKGTDYNFSEVQFKRIPYVPPPDPPTDPDPPERLLPAYPKKTYVPYAAPAPYVLEQKPFYGGSGIPLDYSWHLSVINAGQPRRMRDTADAIAVDSNGYFNPVSWAGSSVTDGRWIIANNQGTAENYYHFGMEKGIPVVGDFDGDGVDQIGVFVDGQWFVDVNGNGVWDDGDLWIMLGAEGDQPVTGDWDGDGKTDIGIFGPSWIGDPSALQAEAGLPDGQNEPNGGYKNLPKTPQQSPTERRTMKKTAEGRLRADAIDHVFRYGTAGDRAVAGDWNGDGIATIGIYRNGVWYLDVDGNGQWSEPDLEFEFGQSDDVPVVGDWNGDGIDQVGVYRAGKWRLDTNGNRQLDAQDQVFSLGGADDTPIVGDFDGDGTDQIGVYQSGATPDRQAVIPTSRR